MLIQFEGRLPQLAESVWVEESARVIGDVVLGAQSSVWFNVVIRGDVQPIRIGARTNIQDNTTLHVTTNRYGTHVGDDVTVGHAVILHGCTIGDRCLVGMGAIVMDGVDIGAECLIGAGALVVPGTKVPPGQLLLGNPARVVRPLRAAELEQIRVSAANYVELARRYSGSAGGQESS